MNLINQFYEKEATYSITSKQRKQLQHEIKSYMQSYFKNKLGKASDFAKVIIWNDMLILRGQYFLTQPEKYIIQTPVGCDMVKAARMLVAKQHSIDNLTYLEEKLGAKCIHQTYDVDAKNDYWIQVMIFDKVLIEQ